MQITRVEANVRKSIITGVGVGIDGLPKVLRMRTVKLLNKLEGVKQIIIGAAVQDALFEFSGQIVTLSYFDRKLRREFVKTVDLLQWYQGPHWHSNSRAIGAPVHCAYCGYTRSPGFLSVVYCPNSGCPSQEKWRQIIGPSYKPPEDPMMAGIARQIEAKGRKFFQKTEFPEKIDIPAKRK